MTYHDLRSPEIRAESPIELGCLLGLGLKFCIQEERPKELVLNETFERLNRDVRLKYKFAGKESEQCDKKIFVKSTWQPKAASLDTENILKAFEENIRQERDISRARPRATNLSKHQFNILNHLRSNKDIIIIQCDKNLGPGVMQRETYIREILRQHLQDGKGTYRQISKDYYRDVMRKVKEEMREIIRGGLSIAEHIYMFLENYKLMLFIPVIDYSTVWQRYIKTRCQYLSDQLSVSVAPYQLLLQYSSTINYSR